MGYDQQIEALKAAAAAVTPETEEQRAKRERQEKSKKIIAATVDGLSALSNLFFTTKYAPNSYNPQNSQMGKVNERIEALKAERQADADRYNNIMLRLGDAQNARAKTLREMQAQQEAQKLAREKAQREAEAHGWRALLQPDKQREQKGKADRAEQQAITAQAEAENAPAMQQAKLKTEQARAGAQRAAASASYASAANSKASAEGNRQKGIYGTFDGKSYTNKRDYDKAVLEAAREYNKRNPKTVKVKKQVKGEDGRYGEKEVEEIREAVPVSWMKQTGYGEEPQFYEASNIAANLEPLLKAEREKDNTPPSRRGNNNNTPPSRRK